MTKKEKLKKLRDLMEKDESLPLKKGATNLVFGVGNPDTEILFIGEGPGHWEDQKAIPFVGNAGKFLDKLLYLIKLPREDVYITNVVHHRPPANRDPEPHEMKAYGKYLDKMIEVIDPKVIVTLGRFSMGKFIPNVYITHTHGKQHKVKWGGKEILVVPMYHPAAGLRNGEIKRRTEEDFKKLPIILKEFKEEVEFLKDDVEDEQMNLL